VVTSQEVGYLSRPSPIGIQIAFGKPLGDIFFQVRSLIGLGDVHVCLAWVASSHLPVIGRMRFDLT
jgi:hypothetical protein